MPSSGAIAAAHYSGAGARDLRPAHRRGEREGPDPPPRAAAPLIAALEGVDRLVILGDGLELREAAHREAAELAAPFFAEAGAALGPEGELLMLAGNHDHGLVAGWIDARRQTERSGFLGLSEPVDPAEAGPLGGAARGARRARAPAPRLPRRVAARRRVRAARPLRRPALDGADVRAARRRRDGALGRAAARGRARGPTTTRRRWRRSTSFCTSSRSAPITPRSAQAPERRRAPGSRSRAKAARATRCAPPRSAPATRPPSRGSTRLAWGRSIATCRGRRCAAAACAVSARCCAA